VRVQRFSEAPGVRRTESGGIRKKAADHTEEGFTGDEAAENTKKRVARLLNGEAHGHSLYELI